MHHRSSRVGIDEETCSRLRRLQRGTGTPLQKLINRILRDYVDTTRPALRRRLGSRVSWRRA